MNFRSERQSSHIRPGSQTTLSEKQRNSPLVGFGLSSSPLRAKQLSLALNLPHDLHCDLCPLAISQPVALTRRATPRVASRLLPSPCSSLARSYTDTPILVLR